MRRPVLLLASMMFASLLAGGVAWAAAGQLDRSFGGDGKVTTGFRHSWQYLTSVIQLPEGKLLAGGTSSWEDLGFNSHHHALMARYNRDGSLDKSFGTRGRAEEADTYLSDLALAADGKILASGGVDDGGAVLMRFNPDGSVDQDFGGGDGRVEVTGKAPIEIQPDGKIVLAYDDLGAARFNPDGSPDPDFGGGDGIATADLHGSEGMDYVATQDLQMWQGRPVVVGEGGSLSGGPSYGLVARYDADGTLDEGFGGGDGIVMTSGVGGYDSAAVLGTGKIVAGGYAYNGATRSVVFVLVRYNADGTLDEGFGGGDGKVVTSMGKRSHSYVDDLALQDDGKIVAAGYSYDYGKMLVVRYNPNGSLDKSFGGGDGKVLTGDGDVHTVETANEALVQPNGKIVAAGSAMDGDYYSKFFLVRYLGK